MDWLKIAIECSNIKKCEDKMEEGIIRFHLKNCIKEMVNDLKDIGKLRKIYDFIYKLKEENAN